MKLNIHVLYEIEIQVNDWHDCDHTCSSVLEQSHTPLFFRSYFLIFQDFQTELVDTVDIPLEYLVFW